MERTLKVTGRACTQAKPDYLYLNITVEGYDKEYDLALKKGKKQLALVSQAIQAQGFVPDDLKTVDFLVSTDYMRNADAHGRFKNELNGYICRYRLRLGMDLDVKKAQQVLSSLQNLVNKSRTSVDFGLKDPAVVSQQLLEQAARDAFCRAEILARAAGVQLGSILQIEYLPKDSVYLSGTHYVPAENYKSPSRKNFHPENIDLEDEVLIVWQIS